MVRKGEGRGSFFAKKEPKKLLLIWTEVFSPPVAQINKSFLLPQAGRLFFKKEVLAYL
jgi:hypothetical protein